MAPSVIESVQSESIQGQVHKDSKTPSAIVNTISEENNALPPGTKTNRSSTFPDGSPKTTGQHPPIDSQIFSYDKFPKQISGPTIWHPNDYLNHPEAWTHPFSPDEISEISTAADQFLASGTTTTKITSQNFILPHLGQTLKAIRTELLNGKGFILFKNLPVNEWPRTKTAIAYLGLGSHIGQFVSQNGKGHVLGHVKDLGEDSKATDRVRIYRTNARQFFHADDCDVVGLLCLAKAEFGGESDMASAHHVWNILQSEYPDIAQLLTQPIWYFDRKGEVSEGQDPFIKAAVFYLEPLSSDHKNSNSNSQHKSQRVYSKFDPYYLTSLHRYSSTGVIPPLSSAQLHAIETLESVCHRVKLHMILDAGDIQFLSNSHVFHARTEYRDFPPDSGKPKRHLMRLWLSTPVNQGGWRTPYWDDDEFKRGGIQVDDVPEVARLDAD